MPEPPRRCRRACADGSQPAQARPGGGDGDTGEVEQLVVGEAGDHENAAVAADGRARLLDLPGDALDRIGNVVDLDELQLDAARCAGELDHRALRHQPALIEGDDVIADALDLLQDVRGQHDVDPEVAMDLHDEVEHLLALDGIEAVGRFVEHDQARVRRDRLRQLDPLPLPGRHRAECTEPLFAEADEVQRVAGAASAPRRAGALSPRRGGGRSRRRGGRRATRCAPARSRSGPAAAAPRAPGRGRARGWCPTSVGAGRGSRRSASSFRRRWRRPDR